MTSSFERDLGVDLALRAAALRTAYELGRVDGLAGRAARTDMGAGRAADRYARGFRDGVALWATWKPGR